MSKDLDKNTEEWVDKQEKLMDEGTEIVKQASDEALRYMADTVENMHDRQWRKMVMETQIVEMGIGVGMVEHLVPIVYKDMEKTLHKRLKISKDTSRSLRHIYIGRVIKNIRKALNERNQ
jgi:capsular polysaccharide biosynthesis protein